MKRLPWVLRRSGGPSLSPDVIPGSVVLVPETPEEQGELEDVLDDQGIRDGMSFSHEAVKGVIHFPSALRWAADGALQLSVAHQGNFPAADLWVWVVEIEDGSGRRFPWYGTSHDSDEAVSWVT